MYRGFSVSVTSRVLSTPLDSLTKKRFLWECRPFGRFDFYTCNGPPKEIYKICKCSECQLAGRNVFTLSPKEQASAITYFVCMEALMFKIL